MARPDRMRARRWLAGLGLAAVVSCAHTLRGANPEVGVGLPADHAAHDDAQTEWWHFHGHLVDDEGRRYDWFLAFVKQHTDLDRIGFLPVRWFVDPFEVAYFTVTERATGRFHVREKHAYPDTWAASASSARLAVRHDSWRATMDDDGVIELAAATLDTRLRLRMTALVPAALPGRSGYLEVPPRSSHYYYSIPRLDTVGTLTVRGRDHQVSGLGWFKHEWGFLYSDALRGWIWFGVQLSSGHELEIGLLYDHDWNLHEGAFAVVEEPDGAVTPVPIRELDVRELGDTWRSPRTRTVYPVRWWLDVPGRGTLTLTAEVPGQEMVVFPTNLWAGGLAVEGVFDGQRVSGDCFAEVVGLDQPFGRSLFRSGRPARWQVVAPREGQRPAAAAPPPVAPPPPPVAPPPPPPPVTPPPPPAAPPDPRGAALFATRCAPCHGEAGRGDGPAAAALSPPPRDFGDAGWQRSISDAQIEAAIAGGGPAIGRSPLMPASPDLMARPADLAALRRHLRSLAVAGPAPDGGEVAP